MSAGNRVAFGCDLRDQTVSLGINDESPISMEREALGRTTREQLRPHLQREFTYDSRNLLTSRSVLKIALRSSSGARFTNLLEGERPVLRATRDWKFVLSLLRCGFAGSEYQGAWRLWP